MNADTIKRRNRALILIGLNLACWPGLGTLLSRRWISGAVQMVIFLAGFFLTTSAMLRYLIGVFRQLAPPEITSHELRLFFGGVLLCAAAWLGALQSSALILRDMKTSRPPAP